jgi:predicted O-methyltransferase YrrM
MSDPALQGYFLVVKDFKRIGLNTTAGDAMMLRNLVEALKAKRSVEVGSATGFGAVNMGIAFDRTGGQLFTLDIDPKMVATNREDLFEVCLDKVVTCIEGDALKTLPTIKGPIDFVFIDALKRDYFKYFQLIEPKLKVDAVVVADNVIQSAHDMKDYLDYVRRQDPPGHDLMAVPSESVGLRLAATFRQRFGKVGENHRKPQPHRNTKNESGRRFPAAQDGLNKQHGCNRSADHRYKHHGVAKLYAGIELADGLPGGRRGYRPSQKRLLFMSWGHGWPHPVIIIRCSTIGPSASAGKKDSASSSLGLGPSPFGSLP